MERPTVNVLSALDHEERRQLLAATRRRRFARREVVWHEGDPGDSLHLIDSGRVAVRVSTPMGEVVTFAVLGSGASFGELAVLDPDAPRTATVIALEPTATWVLHRDQLLELRRRHPHVEQFIQRTLTAYVQRLSTLLLEALYLPVDKRVLRRLAELAVEYAGADGAIPERRVEIRLTQDDIAGLAGTSRASVNRVLGELATAGIAEIARGRVTICDAAALEKAAR